MLHLHMEDWRWWRAQQRRHIAQVFMMIFNNCLYLPGGEEDSAEEDVAEEDEQARRHRYRHQPAVYRISSSNLYIYKHVRWWWGQ